MSSKILSPISKTIGFQLTLWCSAIFILSYFILFTIAYFSLSASIWQYDKKDIETELNECSTLYQTGGMDSLQREVALDKYASGENPFFVRIADPENNTIFLNIPDQWKRFDLKQMEKMKTYSNMEWLKLQIDDNDDDDNIAEVTSLRLSDGYLVQVGKSTEGRRYLLMRSYTIFGSVFVPVILLGFTGGHFLPSGHCGPFAASLAPSVLLQKPAEWIHVYKHAVQMTNSMSWSYSSMECWKR